MTNWTWSLQNGPNRRNTSLNTTWDDVNQTIQETSPPTNQYDIVNKKYSDENLAGAPITSPTITGDFPIWDSITPGWDNANVNDAIFNASQINSINIGSLSGIDNLQAILYDLGSTSFLPHDIITSITSSSSFNSLIYSNSNSVVQLYEIQSSDSTVNIGTAGSSLDLTVTLPVVNLENTVDVTSFYLLSNPGISQNPYTFLGLNTLTPSFIGFTNSSDNVYIDAQNIFGNLFYSNGSTVNVNQTNAVMGTYTVPANTLDVNGKSLRYRTNGTYVCSTGDITIKVNFGGQLLATIPATGFIGNSGSSWVVEYVVNRNTSGNLNGYINFFASDATSLITNSLKWCNSFTASGINYATTNVMSLTVTTGATGVISWQGAHVDILGN